MKSFAKNTKNDFEWYKFINESVELSFSGGINQIKDSLWFHMYDEIIEDLASNDNMMTPTSEIYQRISSHYLGELLIPFSTIYASQRVCR